MMVLNPAAAISATSAAVIWAVTASDGLMGFAFTFVSIGVVDSYIVGVRIRPGLEIFQLVPRPHTINYMRM